jgi:hypothetical protein
MLAWVLRRKKRNVMRRAIRTTAVTRWVKSIWSAGVVLEEGNTSVIVGIASRMKTTIIKEERTVVR